MPAVDKYSIFLSGEGKCEFLRRIEGAIWYIEGLECAFHISFFEAIRYRHIICHHYRVFFSGYTQLVVIPELV